VGDYDDWLRQRPREAKPSSGPAGKQEVPPPQVPKARVKLRFREQKELDALPKTIESLENEQQALFKTMGDSELYKKDRADIVANNERLEELKRLLAEAYERWEELEQLRLDIENNRPSK
jgi:ATP-binding cassette subfamily F protein uup